MIIPIVSADIYILKEEFVLAICFQFVEKMPFPKLCFYFVLCFSIDYVLKKSIWLV